MLDPKQCVFQRRAAGTEQFFGAQAEAWGIEEVNYSFDGHQIERKRGVRVLTSEELALKDVSLTYVSRLMGREFTKAPLFRKVLQSICWQVSSGQEVVVVGQHPAGSDRQGRYRLGRRVRQDLQQASSRVRSGTGRLVSLAERRLGQGGRARH